MPLLRGEEAASEWEASWGLILAFHSGTEGREGESEAGGDGDIARHECENEQERLAKIPY